MCVPLDHEYTLRFSSTEFPELRKFSLRSSTRRCEYPLRRLPFWVDPVAIIHALNSADRSRSATQLNVAIPDGPSSVLKVKLT